MRKYNQYNDLTQAMMAYIGHLSVVGDTVTSGQLATKFGVSPQTVTRRLHRSSDTLGLVIETEPYRGHFKYLYSVNLKSAGYIMCKQYYQNALDRFLDVVDTRKYCKVCDEIITGESSGMYHDNVCQSCEEWMGE